MCHASGGVDKENSDNIQQDRLPYQNRQTNRPFMAWNYEKPLRHIHPS
jgi:hypothetical protein